MKVWISNIRTKCLVNILNARLRLAFNGCVCYKMITSQNILVGAQVRFFLFCWKFMLHSWEINFFIFVSIPWNLKSMASWWALALREDPFFGNNF